MANLKIVKKSMLTTKIGPGLWLVWLSLAWAAFGHAGLQPVLDDPLPDPYVFRLDGEWAIFGTSGIFFHGPALQPVAMKRDALQLSYDNPADQPQSGIWGFVPYRDKSGAWHGYATLHYGGFRTVVAHFLPAAGERWLPGRPISRWRFDKVLVGDAASGKTSAYESKIVTDEGGRLYLVYSASAAHGKDVHIWAQRLLGPGTLDPSWPPRALLNPDGYRSEDRNPGYIQIVEGASIAKVGSTYVLLYSVGDFALNNYKLGVAYSDTLIPPPGQTYRKVLIPDPQNIWKNTGKTNEICYLLQSEQPGWPNYCRPLVSGPGLGNLVTEDGSDWLVFHAYKPDAEPHNPQQRYVWKLPLKMTLDRLRPMEDWLRPELGIPLGTGRPLPATKTNPMQR